ncbi:MAG: ABC transporter permease subunit [Chloroflexota bacterium]|nr:MAG: ABC transporter permease subunit [Chloroflexota bacterium]
MSTQSVPAAGVTGRRSLPRRLEALLGRDWLTAWLFFAPTLILLFALIGWPFVQGFYMGFTKTIGSSLTIGPFIGFKNYIDLFTDPEYWFSLQLTVTFTLLTEIFKPLLGIVAALLIHNLRRFKVVVSALILLPWIVPGIVQALIWRAMFNPIFGALNFVIISAGLSDTGLPWLGDPAMALWCIVLVNVWAGIPFFAITNLAGLKSIDPDLYSAAAVDGANAWQRFRYITLPGIQYTLVVSTLLSTVWTMNNFGTIYLLTSGGPLNATRVLGILTYERGFNARDFGSGVSIALSTLPVFAIIIWLLASYMQAGTRAQQDDAGSTAMRILRPIVWPFRILFTVAFDLIEWVTGAISTVVGAVFVRDSEHSLASARAGRRALAVMSYGLLAVLLGFELFPFFFAFVTAFKSETQILAMGSPLWPTPWSLEQFDRLFTEEPDFSTWYRNTVTVAVIATIIGVLAAASGAYALVRLRWRGSSAFSGLMLVTYMMPGVVMLIPVYMIMTSLKLINTPYALMVVYPSFQLPFATWLLMSYYRSIPEELEDAARIDGANRLQVFWSLILPLSKPAIMAVTLFAITAAWNEFFFAYILIRSNKYLTLPVGLYQMVFNDVFPIGMMMAASILMAVPVLIIYGYAQKFMTEGLTLGSVKG